MAEMVLAERFPNVRTGELVDPRDTKAVIEALDAAREEVRRVSEIRKLAEAILAEQARIYGTKTLRDGEWKAEVRGGSEVVWDAEELERRLRDCGMPEERIREVVLEKVTYQVSAREAMRAAGANDEYAAAVRACRSEVEKPVYVKVSRG